MESSNTKAATEHDLPSVLTVEEAARFLRVNRKTLYDAIHERSFPARRVGARYCIYREAMLDWLRGDIRETRHGGRS